MKKIVVFAVRILILGDLIGFCYVYSKTIRLGGLIQKLGDEDEIVRERTVQALVERGGPAVDCTVCPRVKYVR